MIVNAFDKSALAQTVIDGSTRVDGHTMCAVSETLTGFVRKAKTKGCVTQGNPLHLIPWT